MARHTFLPLLASGLLLAGCATVDQPAEPKLAQSSNEVQEPTVGSHVRSRRKNPSVSPAARIDGETYKQQADATRTDPTGDQIINARTDGIPR
jgi:hypothetical protein